MTVDRTAPAIGRPRAAVRRRLKAVRKLRVELSLRAVDAAGDAATLTRGLRLR